MGKENVKAWYTSKTLWFNLIMALLTAMETNFALLQPHMAGNIYAYFSFILIIGNAVLRTITTSPIVPARKSKAMRHGKAMENNRKA